MVEGEVVVLWWCYWCSASGVDAAFGLLSAAGIQVLLVLVMSCWQRC